MVFKYFWSLLDHSQLGDNMKLGSVLVLVVVSAAAMCNQGVI